MSDQFPQRTAEHELEEVSERYVRNLLPRNWTSEKPQHDYGVDLRVDIYEEGNATGMELLLQLKASTRATGGKVERFHLPVSTYNHLSTKLQVVMVVKYVEEDREAYWLLLKDVSPPLTKQHTLTVQIPKTNRLSTIDWTDIERYIRSVTDMKLTAMRRKQLIAQRRAPGASYTKRENE
jgi:hypothetical protein